MNKSQYIYVTKLSLLKISYLLNLYKFIHFIILDVFKYYTTIKYIRAWHNSDKKKHDAMFDRKSIDLIANQKPNLPTESDGIADIVDKELLTPDTAKTVDELQNFSKSKKLF